MKFKYFYNGNLNTGIGKKVINQCISLLEIGMDVQLFLVGDRKTENSNPNFIEIKNIHEFNSSAMINIVHSIRRQYDIRHVFDNILESSSYPDIIYARYPYPIFYSLWPFSIKGKKCKIVNEHNTIEHKEFKLVGNHFQLFIDLLLGNSMRRRADGIVGVTNEITAYEVKRSGDPNKPHITIGNGINVNRIKIRKPSCFTGNELNLLCVASFNRWHGIDRLLRGLALYEGGIKVRLQLVGRGPELPNLRLIAEELKLLDNVIFTGILDGSLLDDIFDISHIAVGSLGLHRMDLKEASTLKAREYCARGIPFLYGCYDPDFPDVFPFIKNIPGDESPINIEDIISFAEEVYSDPEHHIKMRAYAQEKLDWSVKMKELKDFCENLVEE